MNSMVVEQALRQLGEVLHYGRPVEILLVGGAAAMVTGVLPASRVTTDCDVMVYTPAEALPAVERAADAVGTEMGLAPNWLNSDVQIRVDALPESWNQRKVFVGVYGLLSVYAASRPDLIAMKVLAGREQDIEDLQAMGLRPDDEQFVRRYLNELRERGTDKDQISSAYELLRSLDFPASGGA